MKERKLLVTGSSGLIGSEVVAAFERNGWIVYGIDNNMRANFFGPQGDTTWNLRRLLKEHRQFNHIDADIRDRQKMLTLFKEIQPNAVVHAAAQPSHDLAASRPFDDFDVNAVGTLNLLEANRMANPNVPFIYMSTNKVYGDSPNGLSLVEKETRWDYAEGEYTDGIREDFTIDQSKHSLFGASKVAADILVQEYGRYFGMPTCCLRGGCLTGPNHSGVELHGFLSYLIRCNVEQKVYRIFGYKGKQVRDNIHSADVVSFIAHFVERPRVAEVYNMGGGRLNSVSILESFQKTESLSGIEMKYEYVDKNREGDHICYISNLSKMKTHYPQWRIEKNLDQIFEEIFLSWKTKS